MLDMGLVRGLITLLTLGAFLGICWWAYRPGNRLRFDEDAFLAFDEDERLGISTVNTRNRNEEEQV